LERRHFNPYDAVPPDLLSGPDLVVNVQVPVLFLTMRTKPNSVLHIGEGRIGLVTVISRLRMPTSVELASGLLRSKGTSASLTALSMSTVRCYKELVRIRQPKCRTTHFRPLAAARLVLEVAPLGANVLPSSAWEYHGGESREETRKSLHGPGDR